ncbi:MAG: alpha/beta hydrolase [Ilumatobacteraceae bacterium]
MAGGPRRRLRPGSLLVAAAALVVAGCAAGDDVAEISAAPRPETADTADTSSDTSPDATSADGGPDTTGETGGAGSGTAPDVDVPELDWSPCEEQIEQLAATECATLPVPLDHADPAGRTIEIAVARIDSASDDDQIGSLVLNPGGPGGSGVDFLAQAALTIPADVQERFDLVSFDPRGVGASTAFDCDLQLDDEVTLLAEGDDAGWEALLADSEEQLARCPADALELMPWLGTNNAARDMDVLRAALGDEQLTYVGFSYGTQLGTAYANLFPDRVRALVLDGAVTPSTDSVAVDAQQAAGFDRALQNFASACDADSDCLLTELGPTLEVIEGLRLEIADVGSFPVDDEGRVLTPGELSLGIAAALYSEDAWPFLVQALYVADTEQDGSILQVLADSYLGRQPDGSYGNQTEANGAIRCADDPDRPPADQVRSDADEVAAASAYFDDFLRASTGCLGFPDTAEPYVPGPAAGAPPILVVGTTGDPATPYEWAVELADFLDSGVLFSVEGEGHTAYGSIECAAETIDAYLIELEVPEDGASCADDAERDVFPAAGESEVDQLIAFFDCLRENGFDIPEVTVADLLDDAKLGEILELLDPNDPDFQPAVLACQDSLPAF